MCAKQVKKRTFAPDGERISALRMAKCWRLEDLAREVDCSIPTVQSLESGKPALLATFGRVASALGVEPTSLMLDPPKIAEPPLTAKAVKEISFRVTIAFDACDETELATIIQEIMERAKVVLQPIKISKGSVIVVAEIDSDDVRKVIWAFASRNLPSIVGEIAFRVEEPFVTALASVVMKIGSLGKQLEEVKRILLNLKISELLTVTVYSFGFFPMYDFCIMRESESQIALSLNHPYNWRTPMTAEEAHEMTIR